MRRTLFSLIAVVALAGALVSSAGATRARAARSTTIKLRRTKLGKIVVNSHGYTLYAFTADKPGQENCQNIRDCLVLWPAVVARGRLRVGPGLKRQLLGTIRLHDGTRQITYGGHPLYTYVQDRGPGDTEYVNIFQFTGYWPAVNAAGNEVK